MKRIFCWREIYFLGMLFVLSNIALGKTGDRPIADSVKQVLFIASYDGEQQWTRNIIKSAKRELNNSGLKIDLRVVYLDAKRVWDEEKRTAYLNEVLGGMERNPDLVITSDKEANEAFFSLSFPLVKEVPVVFCALTDFDKQDDFNNVTGVLAELDYEKTYLLGRKLFPEAQIVYIIADSTVSGRIHKRLAQTQLAKYTHEISIEYLGDQEQTVDDLLKKMENFNPLSFIIFSTWQQDLQGRYNSAEIYYPVFSKVAPAPILSSLDFEIGSGILGGYLLQAEDQGLRAGKLAVRVLNGEKVNSIPFDTARAFPIFDDMQLKRRMVEKSALPEGSIVINEQDPAFVTYRSYIRSLVNFIVILVIVLILFAYFYWRYKKMFGRSQKLEVAAKGLAVNLERKSELLSYTLSSMEEGIIVVDRNMEVLEMNRTAFEKLKSEGKGIGKYLHEICDIREEKDERSIRAIVQKTIETGEKQRLSENSILLPKRGEVMHVSGSVSPLFDSLHGMVGAVILFRDTTNALKQQRFLRISVGMLRFYTWVYKNEKNIFEFGEGFECTGGRLEDFDTLEKFATHVHPDDRTDFNEFFAEILRQETGEFTAAYRVDYKGDGSYEWWECRGVVQATELGEGKKMISLYGLDINIDQHKRIEEELKRAMEKAEESDRLKSAFLTNMSHEIRTPLNGIVGFANLVCEDDYSVEDKKAFCHTINKSSKELLALLDDILNLSRIESNSIEYHMTECDVNEMINAVFTEHLLSMPEHVILEKRNLPVGLKVRTDVIRLKQVFNNIIHNAKKFTLRGNIGMSAKLSDDHQWLEFTVTDTGVGISEENLTHIFERFYKVNEFEQGTGIGLPICKAILEMLGGNIRAESELGKGTTFYFRIPFNLEEEKEQAFFEISERLEESGMSANEVKKHILIAEDTDSNYLFLKALLKKDYILDRARDGIEAVEMFKKNKYDIILMDLKMPRMDGLQAIVEIRKFSDIPIIAQTAYAYEVDKDRCLKIGCTDFLSKPIKSVTIHSLLKKYLY